MIFQVFWRLLHLLGVADTTDDTDDTDDTTNAQSRKLNFIHFPFGWDASIPPSLQLCNPVHFLGIIGIINSAWD